MVSHPPMPRGSQTEGKGKSGRVPALALYRYLDRYRAVFLPSLLALFVTAGLSLAFPYFLGSLIGFEGGGLAGALRSGVDLDVDKVQENINRTVLTLLALLALQQSWQKQPRFQKQKVRRQEHRFASNIEVVHDTLC